MKHRIHAAKPDKLCPITKKGEIHASAPRHVLLMAYLGHVALCEENPSTVATADDLATFCHWWEDQYAGEPLVITDLTSTDLVNFRADAQATRRLSAADAHRIANNILWLSQWAHRNLLQRSPSASPLYQV